VKITAQCPGCAGPAPLLDNSCPKCRTSLMTECRNCGARVHLAEPACSHCHVQHPASAADPSTQGPDASAPASVRTPPRPSRLAAIAESAQRAEPEPAPDVDRGSPSAADPGTPAVADRGSPPAAERVNRLAAVATGPRPDAGEPAWPLVLPERTRWQWILDRIGGGSRARLRVIALLLVIVVATVGLVSFRSKPIRTVTAPSPTLVAVGQAWDEAVAPVVRFVELQRGVPFKFAVEIVFLDDAAYDERVGAAMTPLAGPATDQWLELLRATGLADAHVDAAALTAAAVRLSVAWYDPAAEQLAVRGHDLTPLVRASVAHELTRALDDQHAGTRPAEGKEPSAWAALRSATALTIERAYTDRLSRTDRDAYRAEAATRFGDPGSPADPDAVITVVPLADRAVAAVGLPDLVAGQLLFADAFGPTWLAAVLGARGDGAIAGILDDAPDTDADLLAPDRFLSGADARVLRLPTIGAGETLTANGELGAFRWLLLLGERLGFETAWRAVDGWSGDAFSLSRGGERACLRVVVAGASVGDLGELHAAFVQWASTVPGAQAQMGDGAAGLQVCTPEPLAVVDRPEQASTFAVARARAELAGALVDDGADLAHAECVADAYRQTAGADALVALVAAGAATASAAVDVLQDARAGCGPVVAPTTTTSTTAPASTTSRTGPA
jgi:hypothetical protein